YGKSGLADQAKFFARRGYAVVIQDVRGRYHSEGTFYPYRSGGYAEAKDGYDTVEWAADQSWSNGEVGTFGASYAAGTQWALAHNERLPPHLVAMAPGYSVASYYGQGAYSGGAALLAHNMDYTNGLALRGLRPPDAEEEQSSGPLLAAQEAMQQLYWDLPVRPFKPHQRAGVEWLNEGWHAHETYGDYWKAQDHTRHYDKIDIPVLNRGGWYDIFCQGVVWNYRGVRTEGATSAARRQVRLIMGPYTHGAEGRRAQGQVTGAAHYFPPNATYSTNRVLLRWFNYHLKEKKTAMANGPRVQLYVPGLDEWVGAADFPLPQTQFTRYYLHSQGDANVESWKTRGHLTTTAPNTQEPVDFYRYDPTDPVPSVGGYNSHSDGGVADRAKVYRGRDDILIYQTDILEQDVAVVGPITVTLYASTSARDTDFVVNLTDVNPEARAGALWVAEGARRGRIGSVEADPRALSTYSEVKLLEPGKVYAWKIAVWPTARVFEAGHRIRIEISSSNFPRYSRNLNTGKGLTGSKSTDALQIIHHDPEHPSHVKLPIVPMETLRDKVIDGPPQSD
ncbi:MAG: CocE/NonD family hydrolase, partial [Salinibacter sp.]